MALVLKSRRAELAKVAWPAEDESVKVTEPGPEIERSPAEEELWNNRDPPVLAHCWVFPDRSRIPAPWKTKRPPLPKE